VHRDIHQGSDSQREYRKTEISKMYAAHVSSRRHSDIPTGIEYQERKLKIPGTTGGVRVSLSGSIFHQRELI
jgi:YbbR domain-containing protein